MPTRKKRSAKAELKASTTPIELGSDAKVLSGGYCAVDTVDGKTYRIILTNGAVGSEEVT